MAERQTEPQVPEPERRIRGPANPPPPPDTEEAAVVGLSGRVRQPLFIAGGRFERLARFPDILPTNAQGEASHLGEARKAIARRAR
jgi:hypothetical protein